jgi:hypothetical protein
MKNRKICILVLIIALLSTAVLGLIGCSGGEGGDGSSDTVNVTFNLSYAPSTGSQLKVVELNKDSDTYTLSSLNVLYNRVGYEFLGYYDSQTGGVQIFDENGDQKFAINSDIVLYAQWNILTYQKTFVSSSAYAIVTDVAPIEVKFGQQIQTLPEPTILQGYDFVGWASGDIENDGFMISDGTTVKNEYKKVLNENSFISLDFISFSAITCTCSIKVPLLPI